MEIHWVKDYAIKGIGFRRGHLVTEENDVINGVGFLMKGRTYLDIAHSNTPWVDDNGKRHKLFAIDDGIIFIHKIAICFRSN